jgi:UDP-N-acetylglucosamine:LPS N-acetylglucosamine transferase
MIVSSIEEGLRLKPSARAGRNRVVIAMIEAGGGHRSPAVAVGEALEELAGDRCDILLTDFMKDVGCTQLDERHKESWNYLLSHPGLCKTGHLLGDMTGPVSRSLLRVYLLPFYDYVRHFLLNYKPDLVFSTHFFNTVAIDQVRKQFALPVVLMNYHTEIFDTSFLWVWKGIDYYLVSSEEARAKLILRGVARDRLHVFNYPIRRAFDRISSPPKKEESDIRLDPSKKTLLISLGGQGHGNVEKLLAALVAKNLPLNVIFVAGRNSELRRRLERRFTSDLSRVNLVVLGFVDDMAGVMDMTDAVFIKPGPSTTMEAVYLRKPILFSRSAQLSENGNIDFAVKKGIGYYVGENQKRFLELMESIVYGDLLEKTAPHFDAFVIKNGASDIAGFIADILDGRGKNPTS